MQMDTGEISDATNTCSMNGFALVWHLFYV